MQIGSFHLSTPIALAPMSGITDKPFRQLCHRMGATWTVSEMLTSDPTLQQTKKTNFRNNHENETGVIVVQIAGSQPEYMAQAAKLNVEKGAQVIDINMGCPAKKVCHVAAGSALLQNEPLVAEILNAVVKAVDVPVTLKTRLGWDNEHRNIRTIAQIAEDSGIQALAIHGRTRTQMYQGVAEYDLIEDVCRDINIPVWVNGDLNSPQKAWAICQQTGADGIMIGRAAQGQPWLFRDLHHYYHHGQLPEALPFNQHIEIILQHLTEIHAFYGETIGVRIARKHIGWYIEPFDTDRSFRHEINQIQVASEQYDMLATFLHHQEQQYEQWPCHWRT